MYADHYNVYMFTHRNRRLEKGRREIVAHLQAQLERDRRTQQASAQPFEKALAKPKTAATKSRKPAGVRKKASGHSHEEMIVRSGEAVLSKVVKHLEPDEKAELRKMLSGLDRLNITDAQRDKAALKMTVGFVMANRGA